MFCDNLNTQTKPQWRALLYKTCKMKLHFLPSGVTDELQTIDDGVGNMVKRHMGASWATWLGQCDDEGKSNLDRMIERAVSASERRVLLTKFLGDA